MKIILKHVSAAAAAGFIVGGLAGAVEFTRIALAYFTVRSDMFPVFAGYSLNWAPMIGVLGPALGTLTRKTQRDWGSLAFEYSLLTVLASLSAFLVYKANYYWCPSPLAASSIIANSIILVLTVVLLWMIHKFSPRISGRAGVRVLLAALVLWCAVAVYACWPAGEKEHTREASVSTVSRPNVILLMVDTLRADHMGCYGYGRPTSPAMDRLASAGVRFDSCIAASSWTRPSTASILTGLFPASHGLHYHNSVLPKNTLMIPDALGVHGYRTAYITTNPMMTKNYGVAQHVDFYGSSG